LLSGSGEPHRLRRIFRLSAKIIQEIITLIVLAVFAYFYLKESPRWNYVMSFACLVGAVTFAFWDRL
jgi:uncharacterized protein (DUF486 family)